jgi:hypothetical protein
MTARPSRLQAWGMHGSLTGPSAPPSFHRRCTGQPRPQARCRNASEPALTAPRITRINSHNAWSPRNAHQAPALATSPLLIAEPKRGSPFLHQSIICLSSGQCYCPSALPQRARPRSHPPDPCPPRGRGHIAANRGRSWVVTAWPIIFLAVAIWRRFPRGNRTGVRCAFLGECPNFANGASSFRTVLSGQKRRPPPPAARSTVIPDSSLTVPILN